MDTFDFSVTALDSFRSFVNESPLDQISPHDHKCLADFIYTWVTRGGGSEVCQRDFSLLQLAIQVIADNWHRYDTALDYIPSSYGGTVHIERRVDDMFPPGMGVEHPILDPSIFA